MNLFCLPFAGGSKSAYYKYVRHAPDILNVVPLELPGRGSRYAEPLLTGLDDMVEDIIAQIRHRLAEPYAIYGHSMGALLGYLLAKRIVSEQLSKPFHLFLTGKGAPSAPAGGKQRHLLPKAELVADLKGMGGMPDLILNNDSLLDLFLPIIRADFRATETFRYCKPAGMDIPITIITGSDEHIAESRINAWRLETNAEVSIRQLPGGHFFIFDHVEEILAMITNVLFTHTDEDGNSIPR